MPPTATPAPPPQNRCDEATWSRLLVRPLPHLASPLDRLLVRGAAALARRQVRLEGDWEAVGAQPGGFVLVANHGSRRDALYLPALLVLARGGRPVHFLADWNFRLIPGVGWLYRRAGAITVPRKPARPRFLNYLKPLFELGEAPMAQARQLIARGAPVGIFPEGTVNRDPYRLLRGRFGAARLSLETGVPVVPVGIRFARVRGGLADSSGPMTLRLGPALAPLASSLPMEPTAVRAWHAQIMTALAGLSGREWPQPHSHT